MGADAADPLVRPTAPPAGRSPIDPAGAAVGSRPTIDPTPLLRPRSVAVVGANDRPGSYGDVVFRNLAAAGFEGAVWGVNPKREEVHGRPCVPRVVDLPVPVDALVVAIPAAGCPAVIAEAGERGCGGAIVLAAGFGETAAGRPLEAELKEAAALAGIPICGPNGNGVVAVAARAPLWGDSVERLSPGPVAVVTQSGNFGVNALGSNRGIGFHTVVSTGNSAVLEPSDWLDALARTDGVGSIALMLESDGDGTRLAEALATCAERRVGVAVLKVGSSERGARAAGAHTGALAGDQRVFDALLAEAGAARAQEPGELLELARALAQPSARPTDGDRTGGPTLSGGSGSAVRPASRGGLAVLTCSGGDSGVAADLAAERGLELPEFSPPTRERLAEILPSAATVANPLDYTSMLWDEPAALEEIAAAVSADPAIDQLLLLFDQPRGLDPEVAGGWKAVRRALLAGAARGDAATLLGSTLPELLDPTVAAQLTAGGRVATAAGLDAAIAAAAALRTPFADPARLREIAAAAGSGRSVSSSPDGAPGGGGEAAVAGERNDSVVSAGTGRTADSPAGPIDDAKANRVVDRQTDSTDGRFGKVEAKRGVDGGTNPIDGRLGEAEAKRGVDGETDPIDGRLGEAEAKRGVDGETDSTDGRLGEAEAKRLLARAGLEVPAGAVAVDVRGAVEVALGLGLPVALKLSSPSLLHKSEAGALELDLRTDDEVRDAAERLLALREARGATLLVERMAGDGVELIFAVRRDGVVPALLVGVGGIWAEALDDVALIPLPATAKRVERALHALRAAPLLTGARGGEAADLAAAGRFGARLGEIALAEALDLLEVNPALATASGCTALDAVAIRSSA